MLLQDSRAFNRVPWVVNLQERATVCRISRSFSPGHTLVTRTFTDLLFENDGLTDTSSVKTRPCGSGKRVKPEASQLVHDFGFFVLYGVFKNLKPTFTNQGISASISGFKLLLKNERMRHPWLSSTSHALRLGKSPPLEERCLPRIFIGSTATHFLTPGEPHSLISLNEAAPEILHQPPPSHMVRSLEEFIQWAGGGSEREPGWLAGKRQDKAWNLLQMCPDVASGFLIGEVITCVPLPCLFFVLSKYSATNMYFLCNQKREFLKQ